MRHPVFHGVRAEVRIDTATARQRCVRFVDGPVLSWVVSYQSTTNREEALAWSNAILGVARAAAFFLAPSRFVRAERTGDSLSLSLSDGDGIVFLMIRRPP